MGQNEAVPVPPQPVEIEQSQDGKPNQVVNVSTIEAIPPPASVDIKNVALKAEGVVKRKKDEKADDEINKVGDVVKKKKRMNEDKKEKKSPANRRKKIDPVDRSMNMQPKITNINPALELQEGARNELLKDESTQKKGEDVIAPTIVAAEEVNANIPHQGDEADQSKMETAQNAMVANKSKEVLMSGGGRHGGWEIIPLVKVPAYPKARGDRSSRELAKLATSMVGAQHSLGVDPKKWYEGSEFDIKESICMADRIKNARRAKESLSRETVKEEEDEDNKASKSIERKKSARSRGTVKEEKDKDCKANKSIEGAKTPKPRGRPKGSKSSKSVKRTSSAKKSDAPETVDEDCTRDQDTFYPEDTVEYEREESEEFSIEFSIEDLGRITAPPTYSPIPPSPFSSEFPDDFLEGDANQINQDAIDAGGENIVENKEAEEEVEEVEKLVTTNEALLKMRYIFNNDGVHFFPQLLIIRPVTIELSMPELMEHLQNEDMWVVPIRRPTQHEDGLVALVYETGDAAAVMLKRSKMWVIAGHKLMVEQPGTILVKMSEDSAVPEEELKEFLEKELGPILQSEVCEYGVVVVLPSVDKASEFLRAGFAGSLPVSSLEQHLTDSEKKLLHWPAVEREWADELGIAL